MLCSKAQQCVIKYSLDLIREKFKDWDNIGTTSVYAKICNQGKIVYTSFFPYTQLNMKQSYLMEARRLLPKAVCSLIILKRFWVNICNLMRK